VKLKHCEQIGRIWLGELTTIVRLDSRSSTYQEQFRKSWQAL
jgi:hypothetical protein